MSNHDAIHLAIIPDGNRRWAKSHSLLPWKGHEKSADNFSEITEWAAKRGDISVLTIWCLSTENWKRDPHEIDELLKLLHNHLLSERKKLNEQHIHLIRSGREDRIPKSLLNLIDEIGEETKEKPCMKLHLALDYGGKDEIVRAIHRLENHAQADEDTIAQMLDHPELPPIDLIIRTSGEQRTSNFFLWQSAYAEWKFLPKHFPEVTTQDLDEALYDFEGRKRRFGA
jgi:undecaprenyl diphosphate synthase